MNTSIQLYNTTPVSMSNAWSTMPAAFDSELLSNSASKVSIDVIDALSIGRFLGTFPWTPTNDNCATYFGLGAAISLLDSTLQRPQPSNTERIKLVATQLYNDANNIYDVQTFKACLSLDLPTCATMIAGKAAFNFIKDHIEIKIK